MALLHNLQRGQRHVDESDLVYQPQFFRPAVNEDLQSLVRLLESTPAIRVFDSLEGQLSELIKTLNPSTRFTPEQLPAKIQAHTKGAALEEYGVWVYYPWSERLIHILDEKEFIELRTSRNRYKITREEQEILAKQKIGIIGLSVGQSVALTMAMERTFGEIRLADFDSLELTNMNRIRTGLHNLGVPKVVIAAREIAEIDPFLKVVCYPEGITEDNLDHFLLSTEKLDILIDECDSLDVKILCRQRASALGIPVVMDTSDRGMVDIERFDLEPDRPLLHGLVPPVQPSTLKTLTPQERLTMVLAIVGPDTLSERAKISIKEVGKTITTWPQLASSVALGGAVGTDICRRISLGQLQQSGRFYVDLNELISN